MSARIGPNIVANGLILHFDTANMKSYPGSGTILYDLSNNNNNGTLSNGEFIADNNGYIRNVNNISNFLSISVKNSTSINSAFTTTTGGWTIEEIIWTNSCVYPEADAGTSCGTAYRTDTVGFDWNHAQPVTMFRFTQSCGNNTTVDGDYINTSPYNTYNSWRHRTMIWNRGLDTNFLFINGVYIGSINTPNTSGQSIYAGANISIGSLYGWKHYGRRTIFKIYNRVLSDIEVLQNYNALKSRFI